uniref:Uncharacterized protein n=1 Tax=Oryza rufipogon TaxID=4529 RepID=A0A0E0PJH5_ORYRU
MAAGAGRWWGKERGERGGANGEEEAPVRRRSAWRHSVLGVVALGSAARRPAVEDGRGKEGRLRWRLSGRRRLRPASATSTALVS